MKSYTLTKKFKTFALAKKFMLAEMNDPRELDEEKAELTYVNIGERLDYTKKTKKLPKYYVLSMTWKTPGPDPDDYLD